MQCIQGLLPSELWGTSLILSPLRLLVLVVSHDVFNIDVMGPPDGVGDHQFAHFPTLQAFRTSLFLGYQIPRRLMSSTCPCTSQPLSLCLCEGGIFPMSYFLFLVVVPAVERAIERQGVHLSLVDEALICKVSEIS